MKDRVTLLEIAQRAGVSTSTVSRALKNDPRIPPITGEKLRSLATTMGYTPDPLISELAGKHWKTPKDHVALNLAFIYNKKEHEQLVEQHRDIATHLQQVAARYGYKVTVYSVSEYPNWKSLGRVLHNRGIRGFFMAPIYDTDSIVEMEWKHFSIVSLGPGFLPQPFHRVYSSAFEQLAHIITEVWKRGYRNLGIALLEHPCAIEDDMKRLGAAYAHKHLIEGKGGKVSIVTYKEHHYPEDLLSRNSLLLKWLEKERPEVVIGFNIGVYHAMLDLHFQSPKDIAFATLHCDQEWPMASGLMLTSELKADYALYLMDLLLRSNETGIPNKQIRHNVSFSWYEGATLPDKAKS
ncbi:MAG: LacI family DNA-binding transcriptional regulator [Verrucomicrobiota bacterium]|nr:LacI family DNA-binding transcriptional regulator [Verrucomicrobiota bacterium]